MRKLRRNWAALSFEKKLSIVVVPVALAVFGAAVPLIVRDGDGGGGQAPPPTVVVGNGKVPEFKGVASHLAESRALMSFLEEHDGEAVRLEVGFPKISQDDYIVGDGLDVTYVQLFTECRDGPPAGVEPTFRYGCEARSLQGAGSEPGRIGFLEHGVPVVKGYFAVDYTDFLHMGVRPVILEPLSREQALRQ
jgi:hypothetical protein